MPTLEQQLINLNNEIIAIATSINAKEAKMETLYEVKEEDRGTARIDDLKESIDRLSTKEASLMAERKELRHDIATQPNQGKFKYCQHAVMPLCRMSLRQLIVVSLSKCVLSVELALFEGLSSQSEHLSTSSCQHILSTCRYVTTSDGRTLVIQQAPRLEVMV